MPNEGIGVIKPILKEKRYLQLIGKAFAKAELKYPNAIIDDKFLALFIHEFMIMLEVAVQKEMIRVLEDLRQKPSLN